MRLNVLMLEDVATDAELIERELRRGKVDFASRRVATRKDFEEELSKSRPDVILADFSLPGFDGSAALTIARERVPEVPFIFVSGAIGEERAIESLKQGATDYVLKDRLSRLVPALERALSEARERFERRRAEIALERSEERHRLLLDVNNAIISSLDRRSLFEAIAHALSDIMPFDRSSLSLIDPIRKRVQSYTRSADATVSESESDLEDNVLESLFDAGAATVRSDLVKRRARLSPAEQRLLDDGVRAYVSVPLTVKSKGVGALTVASTAPNRYSDDDLELLVEVGSQVALAVENLLAYEEISSLKSRLEVENTYLQEEIRTEHDFGEIIGDSDPMSKVKDAIATVAATEATVLICGETGTGKEVVARAIHDKSPQRDKALVKVNCAALPSHADRKRALRS